MERFGEFACEEHQLSGEKMNIEAVLNQEMIVTGAKTCKSKYSKNQSGLYLTLQFRLQDKERILFTGSDVLIKQIERYKDKIPFIATIVKIDRYYSFT